MDFSLSPTLSKTYAGACRLWRAVLDFLLPPLCFNCDSPVSENQTLCADCWKAIHFIGIPYCACCGGPFDVPVEEGSLCGACLDREPSFDRARSAVLYDDASRSLVLRLKHADQLHPVPALAVWMVRAGKDLWDDVDVIVPVPLHRWRLLKRRYNQSALLAKEIARLTGKPLLIDVLVRVRATESQGHKNAQQRQENLKGAFDISDPARLRDKHVLVIDDVMTSGATLSACAQTLKKAGAEAVCGLTLARTKIAR
jgi:ComF family protein